MFIKNGNFSWEDKRFKYIFDKVEPKNKKDDLVYLKDINIEIAPG